MARSEKMAAMMHNASCAVLILSCLLLQPGSQAQSLNPSGTSPQFEVAAIKRDPACPQSNSSMTASHG
jgi:hypothetical protein